LSLEQFGQIEGQSYVFKRPARRSRGSAGAGAAGGCGNGSVDASEIDRLQTLQAIARLCVDRDRFARMAQRCVEEIGATSCERSWLRTSDLLYADALIDAVRDPDLRLLVCWLSAAAITADGRVSQ
jgi:hypothetical protein